MKKYVLLLLTVTTTLISKNMPLDEICLFTDGMNIEGGKMQKQSTQQNQIWANLCIVLDQPFKTGIEWKTLKEESPYPLKESIILDYNEAQTNYTYATLLHYYITKGQQLLQKTTPIDLQVHVYRNSSGPYHIALLKALVHFLFPEAIEHQDTITIPEHQTTLHFSSGVHPSSTLFSNSDINLSFSLVAGTNPHHRSSTPLIPYSHTPFSLKTLQYDRAKTYFINNHILTHLEEIIKTQPVHLCQPIQNHFPSANPQKQHTAHPLTIDTIHPASLLEIDDIFNPSELPKTFNYTPLPNKKVAIITGASSGLGRALTETLSSHNWIVWGGTRTPSQLQNLQNVYPFYYNATHTPDIEHLLNHNKQIDLLINNAGAMMISPFEGATKTTIEKIFTLNCFAPIALTQQILPTMKSQQHGIILNLSSTATTHTKPHLGYYAAAKSALEKTMQSLKAELAPTNISIKTVQLGTVNTPWLNNCIYITHPEYHEDLEELIKEMQYTTELAQSPDSAAIQLLNLCPTLFSIRIF